MEYVFSPVWSDCCCSPSPSSIDASIPSVGMRPPTRFEPPHVPGHRAPRPHGPNPLSALHRSWPPESPFSTRLTESRPSVRVRPRWRLVTYQGVPQTAVPLRFVRSHPQPIGPTAERRIAPKSRCADTPSGNGTHRGRRVRRGDRGLERSFELFSDVTPHVEPS
jgi:hypothetical protein